MANLVALGAVVFIVALVVQVIRARRFRQAEAASVTVLEPARPGDHPGKHVRVKLDSYSPYPQTPAMRRRRTVGISAFVGFNGSGKSAYAVRDTLPDLALGRMILSTIAYIAPEPATSPEHADQVWSDLEAQVGASLFRPRDPLALPHPQWIPLVKWQQVLDFESGVLLMDEVQGLADARDHGGLPAPVRKKLFEMRRAELRVIWTTIDYAAADARLRRATLAVHQARGIFPYRVPGSLWPRYRAHMLTTYDGRGFDNFTSAQNRTTKDHRPKRLCWEIARINGRLRDAVNAYDSMAGVLSIADHVAGLCVTCNLKVRVGTCQCHAPARGTGKRSTPSLEVAPPPARPEDGPQRSEDRPQVRTGGAATLEGGLESLDRLHDLITSDN